MNHCLKRNTLYYTLNNKKIDIKGSCLFGSNIYNILTHTNKSHLGMSNNSSQVKTILNCIRICLSYCSVDSQSNISYILLLWLKSCSFRQGQRMNRTPLFWLHHIGCRLKMNCISNILTGMGCMSDLK